MMSSSSTQYSPVTCMAPGELENNYMIKSIADSVKEKEVKFCMFSDKNWIKDFFCSIQAVEDIKKQGRICILDVDVQGVKSIKKTNLNPRYIFISPPNLKELVRVTSFANFNLV